MPLLKAGSKEFNCQAVLFDKDGTLLDFKVMWLEWSRYMIDEILAAVNHGVLSREVLEQAMGIDMANWHVDPDGPLAGGTMSGLRSALVMVMRESGMSEETAHDLVTEVSRRSETAMDWESLTRPVPGLKVQLESLRRNGFRLAVVTADVTERAQLSMVSLQLNDFFDVVIGADLVKNSKPAPDMALLACRLLGVAPGQAVVIGDTPRDIQMARDAGAGSIGVLSGVCTREQLAGAGADAVIESVAALGWQNA
ncbi:HAD family hydrolase [Desulfoscipio geothermicus]|uniref:Phosphoglycolate phosphatase n=1 Tax=Desulfoscipio geothermicus DSM 3669 TaxID=1121426 RepID=A0A1I6DSB0_9FIRM|nr:HAD family hydrolase [Desulfoscipio geothermicus]SFR08353.1 phosphoglycolate phosphatase [Desulfoscipio geothermicus DSM 3669]